MAVLARVNLLGQMRYDTHHALAQESYTAFDFRSIIASFTGTSNAFVVRGFEVVGKTGLSINIKVADSQIFNPKDPNGSMYYGLPDDADYIVELPANQSNIYIEATFFNQSGSPVNQGFWDPLALTGEEAGGTEFTAAADTQNIIVLQIAVNTIGFTEGAVPLATASTGASSINAMEDRRPLFFRLGRGGAAPDSLYKYPFSNARVEPPASGTGVGTTDASSPWRSSDATGAINDKGITTFKDLFDAITTRISEISGSSIWYASGGAQAAVANLSVSQTFFDSESGHSIQPSSTSAFTWKRFSGDLKLAGEGSVPLIGGNYKDGLLRWQFNYGIIEWHLGATFASATHRSYSDVKFTSPAPVNGGNIYLSLERDVSKGSGNSVVWASNVGYGSFSALRTVSGVAGDFAGIAIGDYIRKESEGTSRYYRVVKMKGSSISPYLESNDPDKNYIADGTVVALELHADIIGGTSTEPLKFFRSRYSNLDLVADATVGEYVYQDANRYWLGRRVNDNFILRSYGTMQEGEEVTARNDAFVNGGSGAADVSLIHSETAQYDATAGYQLKTNAAGTILTIKRRKRDNLAETPGSGDNSDALLTYTIDSAVGLLSAGESLWVKLSDDAGGALVSGSVTDPTDASENTEVVTNVWQKLAADATPLKNYDNRDVFLLARMETIDGIPTLVFFDGSIVGVYGKTINQDLDLRARVRLADAPTYSVPFFNETVAGQVSWDSDLIYDPTGDFLRVHNTRIGVNYIDQVVPENFNLIPNLGAHTLVIGEASSTTYIPGDLIVDGTSSSISVSNLLVDDKLISLGVGLPINGGYGAGFEVADDTRQSSQVNSFNGQIYINLTYTLPHSYNVGDVVGVSANQDIGGVLAGKISGSYTVVASGSAYGDAQIISPTVLRIWTGGTATSTASSVVNTPRSFMAPWSIRLGASDGSYGGLNSWVFRTKNSVTAPAITPTDGFGVIPTASSYNMLNSRVPFTSIDGLGPGGTDSTLDFTSSFTWDNGSATLNVVNLLATGSITGGPGSSFSDLAVTNTTTLSGGQVVNYMKISTDYTVSDNDYFISVDTSASVANKVITLPTPVGGRVLIIKDFAGTASQTGKAIQINGTIDGLVAGYRIEEDYEAVSLICNGSSWELF